MLRGLLHPEKLYFIGVSLKVYFLQGINVVFLHVHALCLNVHTALTLGWRHSGYLLRN